MSSDRREPRSGCSRSRALLAPFGQYRRNELPISLALPATASEIKANVKQGNSYGRIEFIPATSDLTISTILGCDSL